MADVNANIGVGIDTSDALSQLKALQRQISQFHSSIVKSSEAAAQAQRNLQKNFINSVNAIGAFSAELRTVRTSAETFTNSLERNKFSMREYFRYAAASTRTFGRNFAAEFNTVEKVALERVKTLQTQYIKMGRDAQGAMQAIAIRPTVLDMQDLGTQTAIAAQKQAILNQLLKQGSTNLLNFGKNTQWAGRQLMVGFTLPLITLGSVAGKTFMELEAQVIKFKKVYGDLFTPNEERAKALEDVKNLAQAFTQYGIAASETVGVAAEAAAAGFQGVDLQRQTEQSLRLSVLGQLDYQKALETTISLQNAFRMSSGDLAESINFLNAVENQTVVSLDDITTAIPKVAPVIQSLGGDVKDLAFFLAAMKEGGVNASEGANALKSGLASLINPTDKAAQFLGQFGINLRAIVRENEGDLKGIVIGFAQALDRLNPTQRAQAIEQLFGKFQFARLSTLFDNVIRDGNQASRVLDLAGASVEDLAAMAESELGMTAESSMNKFLKATEDLKLALAPIGEILLQVFTPFVEFVSNLANSFNQLPDGIKKAIATVVTVIGGLGPVVLMTFGLLANGIANAIKFVTLLRNGYLKLSGDTNILSQQTQYMTMEQLEAAAAAASLDQSHSQLIQTFNVEAGAVNKLRDAYQQAMVAGNKFAAMNPNLMKPGFKPGKFAQGGVVPGSGNRDTVPIMATPGEFVIKKDVAQKAMPFLQALNSGKLPGFAEGGEIKKPSMSDLKKSAGLYKAPSIINKQTVAMDWSTYEAEVEAVKAAVVGLLDNTQTSINKINNLVQKQASHIIPETEMTPVGDTQTEIKKWRAQNLQVDTGYVNNFLNALNLSTNFLKELEQVDLPIIAKNLGISMEDAKVELDRVKQGLHPVTKESAAFVRELGAVAEQKGSPNLKYQGAAARAGLGARLQGDFYSTTGARSYDPQLDEKVAQQVATRVQRLEKAMLKGVVDATKQASPSKEAYDAGRNIGLGAIQGIESVAEDGSAQKAGARAGRQSRRVSTGGPIIFDEAAQKYRTQSEMLAREQTRQIAIQRAFSAKLTNTIARVGDFSSKVQNAGFAISGVAGVLTMFGGEIGAAAGMILQVTLAMSALATVTSALTKSTMAQKAVDIGTGIFGLTKRGGGAGLKSGAGAMANIKGVVSNVVGEISKVGKVLLRFAGVVGVALLAFEAFKFIGGIIEEQKKKITGLGDTAFLTAEKMKKAGELLGFTPAGGINLATGITQVKGVGASELSQADQIRQGETFTTDFADQINAIKGATLEEAQSALNSMIIQLISSGASPEAAQALATAIATEAGKTNVDLSFGVKFNPNDPASVQGIATAAKTSAQQYNKAFEAAYVPPQTIETYRGSMTIAEKLPEKLKQQAATLAGEVSTAITGLKAGLDSGAISATEFQNQVSMITGNLRELDPKALGLVLPTIAKNFGVEEQLNGMKDLEAQLLIIEALLAGVEVDPELIKQMKELSKSTNVEDQKELQKIKNKLVSDTKAEVKAQAALNAQKQEDLAITEAKAEFEAGMTALDEKILALENEATAYSILTANGFSAAEATKAVADANFAAALAAASNAAEQAGLLDKYRQFLALQGQSVTFKASGGGGGGKKSDFQTAKEALQGQRDEIKNTITAYNKLRDSGMAVKQAFEAASDPQIAAALAKVKPGTAQWKELISLINQTNKRAKELEQLELNIKVTTDFDSFLDEMISKANEYYDILEKEVDLAFRNRIKKEERAIEAAEKEIEKLQKDVAARERVIELQFDRPIADLQEEANDLSNDLAIIDQKSKAINEKYDKQKDALEQVRKINQDIINQQKSQISLADALSQGDISAAAQLMQDMRGQAAAAASGSIGGALDAARQAELGALTGASGLNREQIEQRQFEISQQIYNLEEQKEVKLREIRDVQDQIYKIETGTLQAAKDRLAKLEEEKQKQLEVIEAQREKWERAKNAQDLANIRAGKYNDVLKLGKLLVGDIKKTWDDIKSKWITLTIKEVRTSSGGGGSTGGGGTGGGSTKPTTTTTTGSSANSAAAAAALRKLQSSGSNALNNTERKLLGMAPKPTTPNIPPNARKFGGLIKKMANGGVVGGTGMGDVVPAMLTPGEFVVNRASTKQFMPMLKAMNESKFPAVLRDMMRPRSPMQINLGGASSRLSNLSMRSPVADLPSKTKPSFVIESKADSMSASSNAVYNYNLTVNVSGGSNGVSADSIANTVMSRIKQMESQRVRGKVIS